MRSDEGMTVPCVFCGELVGNGVLHMPYRHTKGCPLWPSKLDADRLRCVGVLKIHPKRLAYELAKMQPTPAPPVAELCEKCGWDAMHLVHGEGWREHSSYHAFKPAQASKGMGDCPECGKGSLHHVPACKCDICHVVFERGPLKFVEAHGEGHSKPTVCSACQIAATVPGVQPCPIHGKPTETAEPLCQVCGETKRRGSHFDQDHADVYDSDYHAFVKGSETGGKL